MSESETEPLSRREVGAIIGAVLLTITFASFVLTLRSDVNALQGAAATKPELNAAVDKLAYGQSTILDLLCDDPDNADKRACK